MMRRRSLRGWSWRKWKEEEDKDAEEEIGEGKEEQDLREGRKSRATREEYGN